MSEAIESRLELTMKTSLKGERLWLWKGGKPLKISKVKEPSGIFVSFSSPLS